MLRISFIFRLSVIISYCCISSFAFLSGSHTRFWSHKYHLGHVMLSVHLFHFPCSLSQTFVAPVFAFLHLYISILHIFCFYMCFSTLLPSQAQLFTYQKRISDAFICNSPRFRLPRREFLHIKSSYLALLYVILRVSAFPDVKFYI